MASAADPTVPDEAVRARLTAEWDIRGIDVATLRTDARGTIVPRAPSSGREEIAVLPLLGTEPAADRHLEIAGRLGEGGMGVVWAARQTPLRRDVAVKGLRKDVRGLEAVRALLREARVTGTLEHPNVVPIHTIGRDEQGRPLIVMKRIEGTTWGDLLSSQRKAGREVVLRELEHHLRILIDVAKALHFAHSRGIVHRDVKPDNVMIGGFGEVYLVDWGIAVGLDADAGLDLPLARDVREVVGSPAYMAPEMAVGDGSRIDARTDVYLLGAVLHEVVADEAPHEAPTTELSLTLAYASTPQQYDGAVPGELVAICRTAMSREPDDRFPTAASFAAALQRFLEHRASSLLETEASMRFEMLREALATATFGGEDDIRRLYLQFDECRFGFRHALRIWEGNMRAREQLQAALEMMIGFELAHGSPGAASALIGELPIAQPKLAARVEAACAAAKRVETELRDLRREVDPTAADRPRGVLDLVVAGTWVALHALLYWVHVRTSWEVGYLILSAAYGLYTVAAAVSGFGARETLLVRAAAGLETQLIVVTAYAAYSALWIVAAAVGIRIEAGFALMAFVGTALWSAGAIAVDRRLLARAAAMLAALAGVLLRPEWALLAIGAGGATGSAVMGWLRLRKKGSGEVLPLSQAWRSRVPVTQRDGVPTTRRGEVGPDG
jgi:eukaryotic-like serine/threonine-protein kinase